jgi:hypothetical protein
MGLDGCQCESVRLGDIATIWRISGRTRCRAVALQFPFGSASAASRTVSIANASAIQSPLLLASHGAKPGHVKSTWFIWRNFNEPNLAHEVGCGLGTRSTGAIPMSPEALLITLLLECALYAVAELRWCLGAPARLARKSKFNRTCGSWDWCY